MLFCCCCCFQLYTSSLIGLSRPSLLKLRFVDVICGPCPARLIKAVIAAYLNAGVILAVTASVALGIVSLFAPPPGISVPASISPEINQSNQSIFDFMSVHSKVVFKHSYPEINQSNQSIFDFMSVHSKVVFKHSYPEINQSNQSIFDFMSVHSKVVLNTPLRGQLGVKQV